MRVALSSIARGHIYALGARLAQRGVLTRLFCAYPRSKMRREGIPPELIAGFPWVHTGYMAAKRFGLGTGAVEKAWLRLDFSSFSRFVAANLPDVEVFHGLSGHNLKPGLRARQRGAKYICDRGSSHIEYQSRILCEEGDRVGIHVVPIDPGFVEAELAEYGACDRIFVPSGFARRTFIERGLPADKLWSFPYGVDLSRWGALAVPDDGIFRVVYLGSLSLRKGIHDLLAGFKRAALPRSELVLIGSVTGESAHLLAPYLGMPNLVLPGRLPHAKVLEWFGRSSVFVLPSIEDGFGLVLMEAQACGLPLIATQNTGGPDIIEEGRNGFVVPVRDPEAIAARLIRLQADPALQRAMKESAIATAHRVKGWDGFADTMLQHYESLLKT